jgi:ApbE superfamily uncharacterized protein (UPF0280 family)
VRFEERSYRRWIETDLRTFEVRIAESDLLISAERPLRELAERALRLARADLQGHLARDPDFERALVPREPLEGAPLIVRQMAEAARACGVGPMAAVAGAVAQAVGEALLAHSEQVIVENGGDIFLYTARPRTAAIYAGSSPLSGKLALKLTRLNQPLGVCTSSGTVGPSLSFGKADAAIVLAESAALADAAATALGNRVKTAADIEPALELVSHIPGIYGLAAVIGEHLGAWGEMELVRR